MRLDLSDFRRRPALWALGAVIGACALMVVVTPLELGHQLIFASGVAAGVLVLDFWKSRWATISAGAVAGLVSTRYIFWRGLYTLHFRSPFEAALGWCLFLTELYAWIILLLGLVQTAWSLNRKPVPISGGPETWPTIDVFIPTYNEDLALVRHTVFAALAMDYPRDRFNVFILDDGRRAEFAAFAQAIGCGYLTRKDNRHAKAGNLNSALARTRAELVVVFDSDHVPTRSFLQLTVGWFQRDPKLALLQTPHHFYSPDPFQRNLRLERSLPGEGELFYGAVQQGNDLWNAAFFCGSCAVIRRAALEETRGFAHETVTEDAHTALKLQRKGWNTAYLPLRLAAGLATERLSQHVGQRIRWARGMTQIMRIDNPLTGPGLSLPQRLCYLNAMLHFQFPAPRIVMLTSPLAFLFFGQSIIGAPAALIFAYAAPHLLVSLKAQERVHGGERGAFWGEIYEALLAFHLLAPTFLTFFAPHRGRFNVTDKGGVLAKGYFDSHTLRPHLITAGLLGLGLVVGLAKIPFAPQVDDAQSTLMLNVTWTVFNLLILIGAISVGREARQVRRSIRIPFPLPVTVYFDDGFVVDGPVKDISYAGVAVRIPDELLSGERKITDVEIPGPGGPIALAVAEVAAQDGLARLAFGQLSLEQERRLTVAIMGRADAWSESEDVRAAKARWRFAGRSAFGIARISWAAMLGLRSAARNPQEGRKPSRAAASSAARTAVIVAATVVAALAGLPRAAVAQDFGRATDAAPASAPESRMAALAAAPPQGGGARRKRFTLKDLGVSSNMRLAGAQGEVGISFGLRKDEVVTDSALNLTFSHSRSLLPDLSQLLVVINGETIKSTPLTADNADLTQIRIPLDPSLFLPGENQINIRLVGHYARSGEDPQSSVIWAAVSNTRSWLDLSLSKIAPRADLADLPAPFFDRHSGEPLVLPFVFARHPADADLESAAVVASWFGALASYKGYAFKPLLDSLPPGNAVVFVTPDRKPANLNVPVDGPGLAILANPVDPFGRLLVVMGRNDTELKLAAAALAGGAAGLTGSSASAASVQIPAYKAYEAPRWLPTNRPVQLSELIDPSSLVGKGLPPGPLTVRFQAAPDLFFWPHSGGKLTTAYRYPSAAWLDTSRSRLDLSLNGQYLQTLPLAGQGWISQLIAGKTSGSDRTSAQSTLPSYALFSQNELLYYFDLITPARGGPAPSEVRVSIEPESTIDLRGAHHAARLPNLSLFASGGFPFTRRPDLSDTVAILPADPTPPELEAFLALMGRFGDVTGVPAYRLTVARTYSPNQAAGKHVLVVGPTAMTGVDELFARAPLGVQFGKLFLKPQGLGAKAVNLLRSDHLDDPSAINQTLVSGESFAGLISFRAPQGEGWVVALMAARPELLPKLAYAIQDQQLNSQIQGDLSILGNDGLMRYQLASQSWVGDPPAWLMLGYGVSRHPLLLSGFALLAAVLIGVLAYGALSRRQQSRLGADDEA